MSLLEDIKVGARFLSALPSFLRHPVSVEEARTAIRERLANREADFLALVKTAVFENPRSPYRQLFQSAACEFGDVARVVRKEGLEAGLAVLFRHGIYLTADEFKGKAPTLRGGTSMTAAPSCFQNPAVTTHIPMQTSGSSGAHTVVGVDLRNIRDKAIDLEMALHARRGIAWEHANWMVPGGYSLIHLLEFASMGVPQGRWFSQLDPRDLSPRYVWSGRALRWAGRMSGPFSFPRPEFVSTSDPTPIVKWMRKTLERRATPHLFTYPSSAVRVCEAAMAAGISLEGVQFTVGGEPCTASRLRVIRNARAAYFLHYGTSEAGTVAQGCLDPQHTDDVHTFKEANAMIHAPRGAVGVPSQALFVTSIRPTARLILINVALGDEAVLEERKCTCPLGELGWTTHLFDIRSYQKLTAAGMNLLDADVVRVLEEALPARFGGGPLDYQLAECEDPDGHPRLKLFVNPSVGAFDPDAVADAFLAAVGHGSGAVTAKLWKEAGILTVESRAPLQGATGKIQHLHFQRDR